MVKKKSTEATDELIPEVEAPEVKEQPEAEAEEAETNNEPVNDAEAAPETAAPTEIPDKALAYLKRHPQEKEVYIDRLGGVFSANTPKVFVKDAVLYQNPFFK